MDVSPPKIAVVGSIYIDVAVRCAKTPAAGQGILAETSECCGGKGANQAVAALAGAEVSMVKQLWRTGS